MIFTRELLLHTSYFFLNLMMRKRQQMLLALRASYVKKTLTRCVASLAPGYRAALLSSHGFLCIQVTILVTFIHPDCNNIFEKICFTKILLCVFVCRGILSIAWCPQDPDLLMSCAKVWALLKMCDCCYFACVVLSSEVFAVNCCE